MDNTKKLWHEIGADAMLVESSDLRAYLTGFFSSYGFVYTDFEESVFFTDPRYAEGAKNALKGERIKVEIAKTPSAVFEYIKAKKIKKLAVPLERITLKEYEIYKKYKFKLIDAMPAFVKAMGVKSQTEIDNISLASKIAEKAYDKLLTEIKEGVTENQLAATLEYYMRSFGAQDRSFETIIAFGKNSAVPHHAPNDTKLKKGMPVLMDFGCKVNGYCSDITRTVLFGKGEDFQYFEKVYKSVLSAHVIAFNNIKEGDTGHQADAYARQELAKSGLDKFFTHSLGHGIGINIHEYPTLRPNSKNVLQNGMVFSIEPGVYFEGEFGIRIEDSVCLENGKVKSFMQSDKNLIIL